MTDFSIVIPSVGRPSLAALLHALNACEGERPESVVVVDDRTAPVDPVVEDVGGWVADALTVRFSSGLGPAAARNVGWRACDTEWVAFLDDDVLVPTDWLRTLCADLDGAADDVAGSQATIEVPLPSGRRPTDWERGTAGLAEARWITADMAYRRAALIAVHGFDERFPRAFREDADLALRVLDRGWRLERGRRRTRHPVRPAPWNASVAQQRGNADDPLMTRLHGRDWYRRAEAPRGRRREHLLTTAALVTTVGGVVARRPAVAKLGAAVWAATTAEFSLARSLPGPADVREIGRMIATSALIPPAATWHWLRGVVAHRNAAPWAPPIRAVLFDRDGTLVHDVPYNGDPQLVEPVEGAKVALDRLRAAGVKIGVVTNQSAVARGLISAADVQRVNGRVEQLLGPFDVWQVCPHDETDRCRCRKPQPGMLVDAARALGVPLPSCAMVGDTAADVAAAEAAGAAAGILVPNEATRTEEVLAAQWRMADLAAVADAVLARTPGVGA